MQQCAPSCSTSMQQDVLVVVFAVSKVDELREKTCTSDEAPTVNPVIAQKCRVDWQIFPVATAIPATKSRMCLKVKVKRGND
jgi:hypothetical protein